MNELSAQFIEEAIERSKVWDFANDVLYRLCKEHPKHVRDDVIVAKFWVIGRTYAAAIERRRNKRKVDGDNFYTNSLSPVIRSSNIDGWFDRLRGNSSYQEAIHVHKMLTDLLRRCTGHDNRSLASKYLHFHFPDQFFIYDSRASESIKQLTPGFRAREWFGSLQGFEPTYARFYRRCQILTERINDQFGKSLSPHELDKVLLYWHRAKRRRRK